MKKIFLSLVFLSSLFSCEAIWNNGPTSLLKDIFKIMDVKGVENLEIAVQQSNFRWIRPKGLELWDRQYSLLDTEKRAQLEKVVRDSALAKVKMPCQKHYDAIVIMGATTSRVKSRIEFLNMLHRQGIACDKMYLLGSSRDLKIGSDADKDMAKTLEAKNIDATETNMMNELWLQERPEALKDMLVVAVQASQRPDGMRASAEDTLKSMAIDFGDVNGKSFLFISNNPYIPYQDAVVKKVLAPYGIRIETVGEAMGAQTTMENVLDTVARCLTNIQK